MKLSELKTWEWHRSRSRWVGGFDTANALSFGLSYSHKTLWADFLGFYGSVYLGKEKD